MHICTFISTKKIFEVKIGTAIPFMKDIYSSKFTEEHTFSKELPYVLNTGRANKKNIHMCLYSECTCKIHCVVYAAK